MKKEESNTPSPSEQNPTFGPIVEQTMELLDHNDWRQQYIDYGMPMVKNLETYKKKGYRIKRVLNHYIRKATGVPLADLQLYTTLSRAKGGKTFDLRFRGQHMSDIDINEKGKTQLHPYKSSRRVSREWHSLEPEFEKEVDASSKEAEKFFKKFAAYAGTTKSPEHQLESLVLRNIAEKISKNKHQHLRYIQPIKLGGGFFQLPTKLSASEIKKENGSYTHKIEFSNRAGGGIDIFARISKKGVGWRLAVIELKDQNKPSEDAELALAQAMAYATLVAYLLDDKELGKIWYNIFREKTKKEELSDVPNKLDILVMSMMPPKKDGSKEKELNEKEIELKLKNKTITFIPCSCYIKAKDNFAGIEDVSGSYIEIKDIRKIK